MEIYEIDLDRMKAEFWDNLILKIRETDNHADVISMLLMQEDAIECIEALGNKIDK